MPMKNPPHPGDLIRTEIIEALGLNISKGAEILKVRRARLSDLLHGKAALTPEMALRIEKAFGPGHGPLLRMQFAYDVARTRQHAADIDAKRYVPAGNGDGSAVFHALHFAVDICNMSTHLFRALRQRRKTYHYTGQSPE